jgi:hypothetical protein
MKIDLPALLRFALVLALKLGARELAASILRRHAADLRARVKRSPSKDDDAIGAAAAGLMELAAQVATGLELGDVLGHTKQVLRK